MNPLIGTALCPEEQQESEKFEKRFPLGEYSAVFRQAAARGWEACLGAHALKLEYPPETTDLNSIVAQVGQWADAVFCQTPGEFRVSFIAEHLKREAEELKQNPHSMEEIADCFLIVCHAAWQNGGDLLRAAREKFTILKTRKWSKPDAEGVMEHVREPEKAAPLTPPDPAPEMMNVVSPYEQTWPETAESCEKKLAGIIERLEAAVAEEEDSRARRVATRVVGSFVLGVCVGALLF